MREHEEIQIIGGLWVQYQKAVKEKALLEERLYGYAHAIKKWSNWLEGMGIGEHPVDRLPSGGELEALVKQVQEHGDIVSDLRGRLEVLGCRL